MSTEAQAINYKIGNERLVRVTDNAARNLSRAGPKRVPSKLPVDNP